MKIKTPSFWYRSEDSAAPLIEKIMVPISWLYGLAHKIHQSSKRPARLDIPVICIGNIVTGGSGKTPSALAISKIIKRENIVKNPFFLTRGYGGYLKGPILAHPHEHDFKETGDEALLLSKEAPVIISENRALGANLAIEEGADIILMDDGLQNPGIHKDIKLVVIHGAMGFGNRKMLPAGPLRSPLKLAIAEADGFIIIGEDKRQISTILPKDKPIFSARLNATKIPPKDKKYIAFAGLGYPDKFFDTLKDMGCKIIKAVSFPDHYPYHADDLEGLLKLAKEKDAALITTEKDFERLPKDFKDEVLTLPVEMIFNEEDDLIKFLKYKLSNL